MSNTNPTLTLTLSPMSNTDPTLMLTLTTLPRYTGLHPTLHTVLLSTVAYPTLPVPFATEH